MGPEGSPGAPTGVGTIEVTGAPEIGAQVAALPLPPSIESAPPIITSFPNADNTFSSSLDRVDTTVPLSLTGEIDTPGKIEHNFDFSQTITLWQKPAEKPSLTKPLIAGDISLDSINVSEEAKSALSLPKMSLFAPSKVEFPFQETVNEEKSKMAAIRSELDAITRGNEHTVESSDFSDAVLMPAFEAEDIANSEEALPPQIDTLEELTEGTEEYVLSPILVTPELKEAGSKAEMVPAPEPEEPEAGEAPLMTLETGQESVSIAEAIEVQDAEEEEEKLVTYKPIVTDEAGAAVEVEENDLLTDGLKTQRTDEQLKSGNTLDDSTGKRKPDEDPFRVDSKANKNRSQETVRIVSKHFQDTEYGTKVAGNDVALELPEEIQPEHMKSALVRDTYLSDGSLAEYVDGVRHETFYKDSFEGQIARITQENNAVTDEPTDAGAEATKEEVAKVLSGQKIASKVSFVTTIE